MKTLNIGILGMGTVATGLINIMELNKHKITNILNSNLNVKKVLVKDINKKREIKLPNQIYTQNAYDIINDEDIQIVVELMGGINPAYEYIKASLNNKKHVVTANKALIATYGQELTKLAYMNNVKIMFEASVGGGIPLINTLRDNLSCNVFEAIYGIINGTTNYILTQMTENNLEFEKAVEKAQELGFAEADPSSDINGDDVAYKLSILTTIAFGQIINYKEIHKEGITKISVEDINYARELGYNIKLLASSYKRNNELELRVQPSLIPINHPLSTVKNEFNAVFLKGNAVGELMLYGKGAGSMPTGSAVLGDIIAIYRDLNSKTNLNIIDNLNEYKIINNAFKQYYIRFEIIDKPSVLGHIANIFGKYNISLASVVQRQKNGNNTAPLVFITHEVNREYINAALEEIKQYENVTNTASIIVVEDFK